MMQVESDFPEKEQVDVPALLSVPGKSYLSINPAAPDSAKVNLVNGDVVATEHLEFLVTETGTYTLEFLRKRLFVS